MACQNVRSLMQTFCWCSLNEKSSGIDGIATSRQSSQNFKQNVAFYGGCEQFRAVNHFSCRAFK